MRAKRSVALLVCLVGAMALAGVPSVSQASRAGCAPGNPALLPVTAGNADGDTDWYDASSTETQYIRVEATHPTELRVWAWDGGTDCTQVAFTPCSQVCVDQPALGPFPPGSYQVSVHSSDADYVVTSLPVDPYDL